MVNFKKQPAFPHWFEGVVYVELSIRLLALSDKERRGVGWPHGLEKKEAFEAFLIRSREKWTALYQNSVFLRRCC